MHRDNFPAPVKRSLSSTASTKFFFLMDAIGKNNEPTATQLEALERSYMATGAYVMESPEFKGLVLTVGAHGSRANGTLVRPLRERAEGFDVDIAMLLRELAFQRYGHAPSLLIDDLYKVLKRYAEAHRLKITRWERCVTLEYAGGMCVDIAALIEEQKVSIPYGSTHARVPDRKLQVFDPTNPMGLVRAFDEAAKVRAVFALQEAVVSKSLDSTRAELQRLPDADEVQARLLSRLVQLLKLHRNLAFSAAKLIDASPSSVFLTTLAAAAYVARAPLTHDSPLDLLLDIVETMPLFFQRIAQGPGEEYWSLPNPTAPGDNLASSMNTPQRQAAFVQWHARLMEDLNRLITSIERREGMHVLQALVADAFGKRAAQAVLEQAIPQAAPSPAAGATKAVSRIVTVGTAVPSVSYSGTSKAHTFFGDA